VPDLRILDEPYSLTPEQVAHYRDHAWIKLRDVLPADVVDHFAEVVTRDVLRLNRETRPLEERDTYGRAFLQVMNLWRESDAARPLVYSRRLAGIAAGLMETGSVRLYHDQALYKEAGGGHTPWHADQYYWPLASDRTVTVWLPLQATPLGMGPLEFSEDSHRLTAGRDLAISDESEEAITRALASGPYRHVIEPFEIGDASFHAGWLFHRAGPNTTGSPRRVMTIIYMDAAMRLKAPENANQELDRDTWCPGARVGEVIDTPLNPVLYP
jgi:ectoine hydroxylase-related dioxygenase (phytanoyl-CoA dioxygenase family)